MRDKRKFQKRLNLGRLSAVQTVQSTAAVPYAGRINKANKQQHSNASPACLGIDAYRRKVSEIVETIQHDRRALETNVEESNAKIVSDTDQVVSGLNGGIVYTNKDPAAELRVGD